VAGADCTLERKKERKKERKRKQVGTTCKTKGTMDLQEGNAECAQQL